MFNGYFFTMKCFNSCIHINLQNNTINTETYTHTHIEGHVFMFTAAIHSQGTQKPSSVRWFLDLVHEEYCNLQ